MKPLQSSALGLTAFSLLLCSFLPAAPVAAQTNAAGNIEFVANVQPTDGQPEPARALAFFLLRKSFAEIRTEAQQAEAPKDLSAFIDGLNASTELKAWMKAHHSVDLEGSDFIKQLTADDIVDVPEFMAAYRVQNESALDVEVPAPKPKKKDRPEDHEKYQQELEQYRQALKRYIHANLDSIQGLDADLGDVNPGRRWAQLQNEQKARIEGRAAKMAQTQYLAAKTSTDLEGRAIVSGLAPGQYWLSTLDTPAIAGDLRLEWDVNVNVRSGETTRIELSNLNAIGTPLTR